MSELAWFLLSTAVVCYIINKVSSAAAGSLQATMDEDPVTSPYDCDRYIPSIEDVLATKDTLFKNFKLPIELIDTIIDFAEYFPRTSICRSGGELHVRAGGSGRAGSTEDRFIVSLQSYLENLF